MNDVGKRAALQSKVGATSSRGFRQALVVLDVGIEAVPPEELSRFVAQRANGDVKPAVRPIVATNARFHLSGLAGSKRVSPELDHSWQVVRMHGGLPVPAQGFLLA